MTIVLWLLAFAAGVAMIVWGAETFAEHLGAASVQLGVSSFALALLLAGAEPEELATAVVASLRGSSGIALGDVVGANVTICLVALGVGAWIAPLPFRAALVHGCPGSLTLVGQVCSCHAIQAQRCTTPPHPTGALSGHKLAVLRGGTAPAG